MNPNLAKLEAYPFQKLRALLGTVTAAADKTPLNLSIGEPRHATPAVIKDAIVQNLSALSNYPATLGSEQLRAACADWLEQRYQIRRPNPETEILPVCGSREALFSFAQIAVGKTAEKPDPVVIFPNPFYQIYEGAALLAGATPFYVPSLAAQNFKPDWSKVPADIWARTQLVFVCSPNNPTGAVMDLEEWRELFALADRYDFVIASDECYSEIWQEAPPLGGLSAAQQLGRADFSRLVMFTSLSKRSNAPGLRSGFVAGDAKYLKPYLLYRTYHGAAMSGVVQAASIAAWQDETHVEQNRAAYREKFAAVYPILRDVLTLQMPQAGFYFWAKLPVDDDEAFVRDLFAEENVTLLCGSYLAREADGVNPGRGLVRIALVAELQDCVTAAKRIRDFCLRRKP